MDHNNVLGVVLAGGKSQRFGEDKCQVKLGDKLLIDYILSEIVDEFKSEFKDRVVGYGTYDIGMPNGATHWVGLTGKDTADHLMLYDKMEKNKGFVKLLTERGGYELIKDFSLKIISSKQ